MLIQSFAVSLIIYSAYIFFIKKKKEKIKGVKTVPFVEGSYPFFGHGIQFSKDIIGFTRKCYREYGKIFKLKIFNRNIVVICDRSMVKEYFRIKEEQMSMYSVLTDLFFADAFSDDPSSLPTIITIVKKTIAVRFSEFVPKIRFEAEEMIKRLKLKMNDDCSFEKIKLTDEMIRFVSSTSARCFVDMELNDEIYEVLMKFTNKVNQIVVLTYFFPLTFLRYLSYFILRPYRKQIVNWLKPEIAKYRIDKGKINSMIIRTSVDYVDEKTKKSLTDDQIGDIIVCLLYVSSENTALGLSAVVTDLAVNQRSENGELSWWDKVKYESYEYLKDNNDEGIRNLYSSKVINSCMMESARLQSHIFALQRKPMVDNCILGGYDLSGADSVALCEPMLMSLDCSSDVFKDAHKYDPSRYLEPRNESDGAESVMTWGSGIHLCPGKMFAIYEIKMAMALITQNFNIELPKDLPPLNYFSPSAFSERDVVLGVKKTNFELCYSGGRVIEKYKDENNNGWLIRNYLNEDEQKEMFQYSIEISKNSDEHFEIMHIPQKTPYPIAYYNLVYTGTSNCDKPVKWINMAKQISELFKNSEEFEDIYNALSKEPNSVYAQLYGGSGKMCVHKDEYVDWGISVNLGASTRFIFGNQTILLNSGDIFITDFSKTYHGIDKVHPETMPKWFINDFDRKRASIQIRHVREHANPNLISRKEFVELLRNG